MLVGEIERWTNIRKRYFGDFESSINAKDIHYDSEDAFLTGYVQKSNRPQFKNLNRSQYGKVTDFKQEIFEYTSNISYIPTSSNCFIKCNKYLTSKIYIDEFLTFIRVEKRRSKDMTTARTQPFCKKHNINKGCFDGSRINSRIFTEKSIAFSILKNHFCLFGIRKCQL